MGFPSKNIGVGCHFLLQGDLANPGLKPASPALQALSLETERSRGEVVFWCVCGSETKPYFLLQPPSTLQVLCLLISPAEELEAHSISQLHSLTLFLAPLASSW